MKTLMIRADIRGLLIRLLQNPMENRAEIVEVVASDSNLEHLILTVVNNPFFGSEEKVVTVNKAFDLMGIGQISELLLEELAFEVPYSIAKKADRSQINHQVGFELQQVAMI